MENRINIIKKYKKGAYRNFGKCGGGGDNSPSQRMNIAARGKALTSLPGTEERRPIGHRETSEEEAERPIGREQSS
jgi:hypothetical protein